MATTSKMSSSSRPPSKLAPPLPTSGTPFQLHNYLVDLSQYYRYAASFTAPPTSGGDAHSTEEGEEPEDGPHAHWLKIAPLLTVHHIHSSTTTPGTSGNGNGNSNKFRKSWGNFVNIYDEHGRQRQVIELGQLTNYMELDRYSTTSTSDSTSSHPLRFYASLFTGNYPRPLYSGSGTNWRMRYNLFVSGVDLPERLGTRESLLHLGELHLYLHVERGQSSPRYQNLCFFYDRNLPGLVPGEILGRVALELKGEMARPSFVEQLFLPLGPDRFRATDRTVDHLVLRQHDLSAAIRLANETMPFAFLHRPSHLFA